MQLHFHLFTFLIYNIFPDRVLPRSITGTPNDALYKELWHACAGPLVTLPRQGERVYYFPQGHMEQVWSYLSSFLFPLYS